MAAPSTVTDPSVPINDGHPKSHPMDDEKRGLPIDRGGTWKTGQQEQPFDCNFSFHWKEYIVLSSRDRELHLIREGKLKPHKKLKSNTRTRREAMEQYLQLVYKQRPHIIIPEDNSISRNESPPPARTAEDVPENPGESSRGFYDSALGFPFHSLPRHLQASFLSIGTIPNSALLQLLWPMECAERRSPREISPEKTAEKTIFKTIPKVEEEKEVVEKEVEEVIEEPEEPNDIPAILQKITANMEEQSSPVSDVLPPPSPPSLPTLQRHEEKRTSLPQRPLISRLPRPRPQPTKPFRQTPVSVQPNPQDPPISPLPNMTAKAAPPSLDTNEEEEEQPLETPTVVPEIPPFILQFQDTSWFSRIFSDIQVEQAEFEARLLHGVLHMELPIRTELLHALQILYEQGNLRDLKGTYHTLMGALNSRRGINMKEVEDLDFLWFCLHFLIQMSGGRRELILELLVTCVQTHPSHRGRFLSLFKDIGVEDLHGFIGRQVTSWDSWEQGDGETLKRTCEDWLDTWTGRLMDYLHGAMAQRMNPQQSHRDGGKAPRALQGLGASPSHVESFNVTPSDVLNYYCELQMKSEVLTLSHADPADESTVLALPPVQRKRVLLRLGETSKSSQRRDQKGVSLPPIPQRLFPSVIPFINLPVKRISMNPFTPTLDGPGAAHLTGSLTQEAHQYFFLQQSYLESYY
ncbi:uncharacterized protein LOC143995707 [Lithobates pipiens]